MRKPRGEDPIDQDVQYLLVGFAKNQERCIRVPWTRNARRSAKPRQIGIARGTGRARRCGVPWRAGYGKVAGVVHVGTRLAGAQKLAASQGGG